ncbi:MAG: mechanosensitive ion channel family protein [Myxococcales bacterium]|nr:mechanosensitive ion channel family protein [Myxococcales bacterium]
MDEILVTIKEGIAAAGLKIVGAILLWIVGRWLIGFVENMLAKVFNRQNLDATVARYFISAAAVLLNIALVVAILGFFGVETTTFAALLAAGGVAIGMAWSGLLSNFAAGVFIVFFRPFKVGDLVNAAGVLGTVREISLFVTVIDTLDNVKTIIGNNKILGDNITNFTANPFRRVDLSAQLAHSADHQKAIAILKAALPKIPNVLANPAPDVEMLEFNLAGPVLAVRPYCHNDNYWQVYFDTNKTIREELGKAGFPVPEQHFNVAQNK